MNWVAENIGLYFPSIEKCGYTRHWMSFLRPGVIKQHKLQTLYICLNFIGDNSIVRYSIVGGDPSRLFTIDSVTGELRVGRSLDREDQGYYNLAVQAEDQAAQHRASSTAMVRERVSPYPGILLLNSYSASHDNWCTATLWNRIITAQCEGMGEVGSASGEVRAGTTSPMPEHKGFKLQ